MRKNLGPKDYVSPMPVLVIGTYDEDGNPNAMTAAWGAMSRMDPYCLNVFISQDQKTTKNIRAGSDFTISLAVKDQLAAVDYVGIASGNDGDKIEKTGWTVSKAECVNAPLFEEFPLVLECKTLEVSDRAAVLGEIKNVSVDEAYLDANGNPDLGKMGLVSFDTVAGKYREIGEAVANAFEIGQTL